MPGLNHSHNQLRRGAITRPLASSRNTALLVAGSEEAGFGNGKAKP